MQHAQCMLLFLVLAENSALFRFLHSYTLLLVAGSYVPLTDYYEGELNQTSVLPCGMLCPFESPRGLEGVLQSMDASLRRTLSMSTALKNATDWDRERVRR